MTLSITLEAVNAVLLCCFQAGSRCALRHVSCGTSNLLLWNSCVTIRRSVCRSGSRRPTPLAALLDKCSFQRSMSRLGPDQVFLRDMHRLPEYAYLLQILVDARMGISRQTFLNHCSRGDQCETMVHTVSVRCRVTRKVAEKWF